MADRDRFELDLAAALRTYLEEAPTEVRPTELAGTRSGCWWLRAQTTRSREFMIRASL